MKKITVTIIDHTKQRYDTLGDYWFDDEGNWHLAISDMGDWRYNFLVALHELVEMALIKQKAFGLMLSEQQMERQICEFDKAMLSDSPHIEDPGMDPHAPYHQEHLIATGIEIQMCGHLGLNFREYDSTMIERVPDWRPKE